MMKFDFAMIFPIIYASLYVQRTNTATSQIYRSQCRKDALFKKVSEIGKLLTGRSESIVGSQKGKGLAKCVIGCIKIPECLSINFYKNSKDPKGNECQLMNINQSTPGAAYVSKPGWVHYRPVNQIGPGCRLVKCKAGRRCIEDCQSPNGYRCIGPRSCKEAIKYGLQKSGVVQLSLAKNTKIDVYCDISTNGGGWIVFQRRMNSGTSFERDWQSYENGFGDLNSNFWLGLKALRNLTSNGDWTLRFDLVAYNGATGYAQYTKFFIGGKQENYALYYDQYSGNLGDSLKRSRGYPFSTYDQDNDAIGSGNCALLYRGAWWHSKCFDCNLNSIYPGSEDSKVDPSGADMMSWITWNTEKAYGSIIVSEMKIREGASD